MGQQRRLDRIGQQVIVLVEPAPRHLAEGAPAVVESIAAAGVDLLEHVAGQQPLLQVITHRTAHGRKGAGERQVVRGLVIHGKVVAKLRLKIRCRIAQDHVKLMGVVVNGVRRLHHSGTGAARAAPIEGAHHLVAVAVIELVVDREIPHGGQELLRRQAEGIALGGNIVGLQ